MMPKLNLPIYLDNHSTTKLDPKVFEAMKPYFMDKFGNASSGNHSFGWEAKSAVDHSRKIIADFIGAGKDEIIFTSGSTESINLAHFGTALSYRSKGNHIITTSIEHSAVLDSLKYLEQHGFEITYLPVDSEGSLDINLLEKSIKKETILVSIMTANNEIGSLNNIKAIGKICAEKNILFHTDAAQAIGKIEFNVNDNQVNLVSFSAHKIYGPKGIGVLFLKKKSPRIKITPQILGGGQENNLRSGTLNVPAIVGFGKAIQLLNDNYENEIRRIKILRDKLLIGLQNNLEGVQINGSMNNRLPNNLNISFEDVKAENLIMNLREIAVSTGAACSSASLKSSHVLKEMGFSNERASSSIRFGLGRFNAEEEIDFVIERISEEVIKIRNESPQRLINNLQTIS